VEIVPVDGELAGEARVQLKASGATNSVVAVGNCTSVVSKLVELTLAALAGKAPVVALRDNGLPENPYLNWRGPISESIPRNPYLRLLNDIGPGVPGNPYRVAEQAVPAKNPYRW
jgi:hypothetical protein